MNKKGFTLVELMASISLLSIVLIFMMNVLVKLRDTNLASAEETNFLVGQAIITKTITDDVLRHGGIKSYNFSSEESSLELNDGENRYLKKQTVTTPEESGKSSVEEYRILTYGVDDEVILTRKLPPGYEYSISISRALINSGECERIDLEMSLCTDNTQEVTLYNKIIISVVKDVTTLSQYNSIIHDIGPLNWNSNL